MQQLFHTEFNGTTLPYIVVGGRVLFPAAQILLAVGYNKISIASHLSLLLSGEKVRLRRNCGWLERETIEALFKHKSGLRVFLTVDGVRISLTKMELGKGMPLLKHITEAVLPLHEPSLLTPKAA